MQTEYHPSTRLSHAVDDMRLVNDLWPLTSALFPCDVAGYDWSTGRGLERLPWLEFVEHLRQRDCPHVLCHIERVLTRVNEE